MKEICDLLHLNRWNDFEESSFGVQAKRITKSKYRAFTVEVFSPLDTQEIKEVASFAAPVPAAPIHRLFQLCNGLRAGQNLFGIYSSPNVETHDWPTVLSINTPNIHERPDVFPDSDLIIGFSNEREISENSRMIIHALNAKGELYLACEETPLKIEKTYETVDEWLTTEFERSIARM